MSKPELIPILEITLTGNGPFKPAFENSKTSMIYSSIIDGKIKTLSNDLGYDFKMSGLFGDEFPTIYKDLGVCDINCKLVGTTPNGSPVILKFNGKFVDNEHTLKYYTDDSDSIAIGDNIWVNYPVFTISENIEPEYKWIAQNAFLGQGSMSKVGEGNKFKFIIYLVKI